MEAGPQDRRRGPHRQHAETEARVAAETDTVPGDAGPRNPLDEVHDLHGLAALEDLDGLADVPGPEEDGVLPPAGPGVPAGLPALEPGALDEQPGETGESFRELRPPRRLRVWQIAPIVGLAILGSLMFAFPLAFEFGGEGGAVVAMLGVLLCCCAAGWGMTAARRVGHTWPGLAPRETGRRNWAALLAYTAVVVVLAALAIWRVARLR